MRTTMLFVLTIVTIVDITGCGDPAAKPDASSPVDGTTDTAAADDAPPASCPAGKLCFQVNKLVPTAAIPNGHLIVAFYQINDDLTPYPPVLPTLDVPFDGGAARIELTLADIELPTAIDDYRICTRTCTDLDDPACDCSAPGAKVALAFVLAVVDADMSGAIEPAELTSGENIYGIGYMQIGAADMAYPNPQALMSLFPEGIENGIEAYRIIESGTFDKLGIAMPGVVFGFDVCVPGDASCGDLRAPNLT